MPLAFAQPHLGLLGSSLGPGPCAEALEKAAHCIGPKRGPGQKQAPLLCGELGEGREGVCPSSGQAGQLTVTCPSRERHQWLAPAADQDLLCPSLVVPVQGL